MMGTGKNVGDLRRSNISLILKLLYYQGAQSRKMLAAGASLTPAAVTTLTNELMEKGYILDAEISVKNGRVGRAEQYIDLNYRGLYMLGLRIGKQAAEIRIYNLGLECIGQVDVELEGYDDADSLFEMLCDKIAFLMVNNDVTAKSVLGVGVAVGGIVDSVGGISVDSFGLLPPETNIREQIEKRLHLPVSVNNNVRSMLMAESAIHHHNQGVSHLFIKYGPGVGAAFSIGQQTYNGAHYRALELGHVVLEPDGELCRCGRRGCLETLVSFKTIFRDAAALCDPNDTPVLHRRAKRAGMSLETLSASVEAGEKPVVELLRAKFTLLARCLDGYATILDPQTISVCSQVMQLEPLTELFNQCVRSCTEAVEDRLVLNPEDQRTEQVGAAALVVHSFLAGQITGNGHSGNPL